MLGVFDSLVNLVNGLGTARDPSTQGMHVYAPMSVAELDAMFRSDWVARKIITIPASDSTREWRMWQAEQSDITKLEAFERNHRIQSKLCRAMTLARLYGGAALILGIDQGQSADAVDVERLGPDSLKFVHVVTRYQLMTGPIVRDVTSPWYGEPAYYTHNGIGSTPSVTFHPSRVVRLMGLETPDDRYAIEGWGDSVLQIVRDAVRNVAMVSGGVSAMISDAKMDVIKIPDLSKNLSKKDYANRLTERFAFANQAKSIVSTLVLDKEEDWERVTTNFGTLPDIMHTYLVMASGAADIPVTRFLGQSPKGLNATGEADTRNYYDRISADQNNSLTPVLSRLDEVLIRSALGKRDPNIYYEWTPLWQLDAVQQAALAASKADTAKKDQDMGLIPEEALRTARINQVIEDATYPGLDDAIDALRDSNGDLPEMNAPTSADPPATGDPAQARRLLATAAQQQSVAGSEARKQLDSMRQRIADSRPRTLYVRRDLLNFDDVKKWARASGVEITVDDPHVTVCYSRQAVDWMKVGGSDWNSDNNGGLVVPAGGPRMLELFGPSRDTLVLQFSSTALQWRHEAMIREGASTDYQDYQPHVTLAKPVSSDMNVDSIVPYRGELRFGPEIFEEVKP